MFCLRRYAVWPPIRKSFAVASSTPNCLFFYPNCCITYAAVNKPAPGIGDTLARKVDQYLAPYLQGNNFTGVVLIARGDRVLVNAAYGLANRSWRMANTPATRFHIASVSKPFTAPLSSSWKNAGFSVRVIGFPSMFPIFPMPMK